MNRTEKAGHGFAVVRYSTEPGDITLDFWREVTQ